MVNVITTDNTLPPTALSPDETARLEECENIISRGYRTALEVGNALAVIQKQRLYRATHKSFDEYVTCRWDMSRSYAYRLIAAAETMPLLSPNGNTLPATESQVRPLLQFPPEDRAQVWKDVVDTLRRCADGTPSPTAKNIEDAVRGLVAGSSGLPCKRRRAELSKVQKQRQAGSNGRVRAAEKPEPPTREQGSRDDTTPTEKEWRESPDDSLARAVADLEQVAEEYERELEAEEEVVVDDADAVEQDSVAMGRAQAAINELAEIPADDPLRDRAPQTVADWIETNMCADLRAASLATATASDP